MRNRKTIVVAFLLVAAMLLGVGYAALTDTLTMDGRVTIDMNQAGVNFDAKVYWKDARIVSSTNTSEKDSITLTSADDINFNLHSLATKGDVVNMVATIQNDSNVPVKINMNTPTTGEDADKFRCTYTSSIESWVIPSGESMTITVVVTVVQPVTSAATASFGVSFGVETVE